MDENQGCLSTLPGRVQLPDNKGAISIQSPLHPGQYQWRWFYWHRASGASKGFCISSAPQTAVQNCSPWDERKNTEKYQKTSWQVGSKESSSTVGGPKNPVSAMACPRVVSLGPIYMWCLSVLAGRNQEYRKYPWSHCTCLMLTQTLWNRFTPWFWILET